MRIKNKILIFIVVVFGLISCSSNDKATIEVEKVVQNYFVGRKTANIKLLQDVFSEKATLYTVKNDVELIISLEDYLNKVKLDGKQDANTKILKINRTNNIAYTKTEFKYKDKTYQDYLTLLKTKSGWKIITKTFTKKN